MMLTPEEQAYRLFLWQRGATDREICDLCFLTPVAVSSWRITHGLSANAPDKTAHDIRMHLYAQGLSDREIAELQKTATSTIRKWRVTSGLPSNNIKREREERDANSETFMEDFKPYIRNNTTGTLED